MRHTKRLLIEKLPQETKCPVENKINIIRDIEERYHKRDYYKMENGARFKINLT